MPRTSVMKRARCHAIGGRRRDRLRLAELVDLHHPGGDRAARRLPEETAGEASTQREGSEESQPPVFGLDPGGTDPLIPDLAGALIRRFGLRGFAITDVGPSEHRSFPLG